MKNELAARPEPVAFEPKQSAVIVVDMQNGYCSPGGYFSHLGVDLSPFERVVNAISQLVTKARQAGMQIVWLQNGWDPQLKEAGGPHSVNQRKGNSLRLMRERRLRGKLLTKGGWDYAIVDALKPCRRYHRAEARAIAASPAPRSTACCAAGGSKRYWFAASRPTSASDRRSAMRSSRNTSRF